MIQRGRRCGVCGQQHASCGGPSPAVPVDVEEDPMARHERVIPHDVVVDGRPTVMRLRPSTAARLYPGATPRHRAEMAPQSIEPEPAPRPVDSRLEELGGGWWGLPDGRRIRGREAAEAALAE